CVVLRQCRNIELGLIALWFTFTIFFQKHVFAMTVTGENFVGTRRSALGGQTFRAFNPVANAALDPEFHNATESEVDDAVQLAEQAFQVYRRKSGRERADFLVKIAEEIEALGDVLINRCHEETGLPTARLQSERGRTTGQLRMFAELLTEGSWVDARIETALPDRQPVPKPDLRSMLIALGPVGVFGASNFPLAFWVSGGATASALAAGCTVVCKGHPAHPGTSELVAGAILRAAE